MTNEPWDVVWAPVTGTGEYAPIALDEPGMLSEPGLDEFIARARWLMTDKTQAWLRDEWSGVPSFVEALRRVFGTNVEGYLRYFGWDAAACMEWAYATRTSFVPHPCAEHAALEGEADYPYPPPDLRSGAGSSDAD